jgi:hypothetical protein
MHNNQCRALQKYKVFHKKNYTIIWMQMSMSNCQLASLQYDMKHFCYLVNKITGLNILWSGFKNKANYRSN